MVVADQEAFAAQVERYRRELQVHCYRMLGSFDESEDLVQETFLRAWRARDSFEGRSSLRAWLYRIATNACLDFLDRHPRQPRPYQTPPGAEPSVDSGPPPFIPWLQPYPDRLLEPAAPATDEPDAAVFAKETIELVFMVAIQHLPPKQRAAVILRDLLGWSANDTAAATDMSVPAVKSALQRARPVLKAHLPERRLEWEPAANATEEERALLQRMIQVGEHGDAAAWAELVTEDIKLTMPPNELWFAGRDSIAAMLADQFDPQSPRYFGEWRFRLTRANRQPAAAGYIRRPGTTIFHGQTLDVMRIEGGKIAQITTFGAHLYPAFGLPLTL